MRKIIEDSKHNKCSDSVVIAEREFRCQVMESEYEDSYQIGAPEGSLVFMYMVTYGYGENVKWGELEKIAKSLDEWASEMSKKHHCTYTIEVSANYW